MDFATYTPPEHTEGDSFKPSEHVGKPLIVKVNEHKHIASTTHKPEGGPGVLVDVCDLGDGAVYRDVLWMNVALVDGLKPYLGQHLVIRFAWTKSPKTGKDYITIEPAQAADQQLAQQYVNQKGDPFPPVLNTTGQQGQAATGPDTTATQPAPPWATGN